MPPQTGDTPELRAGVAAAGFAGEAQRAEGGENLGDLLGVAARELLGDLGGLQGRRRRGEGFLHGAGSLGSFFGPGSFDGFFGADAASVDNQFQFALLHATRSRRVSLRTLKLRPEPANHTAGLFGSPLGIERHQPFENLLVGQIRGPAIRRKHRRIELVMNLPQHTHDREWKETEITVPTSLARYYFFPLNQGS
jgi:hypothetical protein